MSDICFEGLKILVMVAVLVLTRYVLPWVKSKADSEKLNLVTQWAYKAVLMAQQKALPAVIQGSVFCKLGNSYRIGLLSV